jgi:hypothetical protein
LRRIDFGIEFIDWLGVGGFRELLSILEEEAYKRGKGVKELEGADGVDVYGVGPDDVSGLLVDRLFILV